MPDRPNIVLILTDNQSPWTLGCYGNKDIRTPHIDSLARDGVRFNHAYCVNPVCSPNRATALTGLMPSQHGVHSWLGSEKPGAQMGEHAYNTIGDLPNLPDILADAGYSCGLTGKWHLGDNLHPPDAFSYWFTMPGGHTKSFYNTPAIWQGKEYVEPRYFTDVIAEHAEAFLRDAADRDEPFFLLAPFNGPYGLDHDLHEGHRNRHAAHYADMDLPDFPRVPRHPWQRGYKANNNNPKVFRNYAAAVSGVDDAVGHILDTLEATGQSDNTIVIYTSDHGLCGGHHGFWGMGDHSYPNHLVQTNLTIPLLVRHPANPAGGQTSDRITSHYDLLPTLLDCVGLPQISDDKSRPGVSYADILRGEVEKGTDNSPGQRQVFHEHEGLRCVQDGQWKLILRKPDGPNEMYNLQEDPGEWRNLFGDPDYQVQQAHLTQAIDDFFAAHAVPAYDIWQGGGSKAGRTTAAKRTG